MMKRFLTLLILAAFAVPLFGPLNVMAQAAATQPKTTNVDKSNFVDSPAKCGTNPKTKRTPPNCLFLEEPIGGRPGFDLYLVTCVKGQTSSNGKQVSTETCTTKLWSGGAVPSSTLQTSYRGPIQAVLTEDKDKPFQGPFGLLYGYLGLIYNYMSGIIVGVAVLFVVVGGVQMITSAGQEAGINAGRERIKKALIGLVMWFLASLILYTINPTFFTF